MGVGVEVGLGVIIITIEYNEWNIIAYLLGRAGAQELEIEGGLFRGRKQV